MPALLRATLKGYRPGYVEAAIADAKVNAKINQLTNTDFYAGDIKDLLNASFLRNMANPM